MTDIKFPQDFYLDDVGVWRLKKEKLEELEKPKPMTNEEYIKSLNTEQLAGWIADVCYELQDDIWRNCEDTSGDYCQTDKDHWVEWLKEIHT